MDATLLIWEVQGADSGDSGENNYPEATPDQMRAGTLGDLKSVSPLLVAQAITALERYSTVERDRIDLALEGIESAQEIAQNAATLAAGKLAASDLSGYLEDYANKGQPGAQVDTPRIEDHAITLSKLAEVAPPAVGQIAHAGSGGRFEWKDSSTVIIGGIPAGSITTDLLAPSIRERLMPPGGARLQELVKNSVADYDTTWRDAPGGYRETVMVFDRQDFINMGSSSGAINLLNAPSGSSLNRIREIIWLKSGGPTLDANLTAVGAQIGLYVTNSTQGVYDSNDTRPPLMTDWWAYNAAYRPDDTLIYNQGWWKPGDDNEVSAPGRHNPAGGAAIKLAGYCFRGEQLDTPTAETAYEVWQRVAGELTTISIKFIVRWEAFTP